MARVKVGVIGLGEVAQIVHLPILEALGDRYEIAALCDVSPGLLAAVGERYRVGRRYTDAAELAAQGDLDAVFVLNSDEYHADHAIAALRQGKHVLVEKPMCLTLAEAEAIVRARDEAGVQVMVAYMRRFAPAFVQAVDEVGALGKINYARVRDIIGANRLIIEQSSAVLRFDDIPTEATRDRTERAARLVGEAIGAAPPELVSAYRLLCGLASHDLSAMRELIGVPVRVVSAVQSNGGRFIVAIFAYDGYHVTLETGVDEQRRFDAHIEVYGAAKSVRVQYDTPYIRHLPTTLEIRETVGEAYRETTVRPTFTDPYTHELAHFHDVVTTGIAPKTTPEDFMEDLALFRQLIDAMRTSAGADGAA
jgi:predicted dehydrogenase